MKKIMIILFTVLCVSGCATLNTEYEGSDKGYAVMSFYIDNHNFAGDYIVKYENSQGESGRFYYRKDAAWGKSERDFDDEKFNGRVEIHKLKAGTYTITEFQDIQGAKTFHYEDFEPYTFQVKPNQAVYLGELYEPIGGTGFLKVMNKLERDLSVAKTKGLPQSLKVDLSLMSNRMLKIKGSTFIKVQ